MSRRAILSRPRTRVYNANYDIGQSYYQPAIDRLDRKYSGRPLSPARKAPSVPRDILERHERAFTDDDLPSARRRAEQHITEDNLFDAPPSRRPRSVAFDGEDSFDEEMSNTLRKVRASRQRASRIIDDVDLENTVNNISFSRMINKTDRLLDSVGLNEKSASRILEDEPIVSRRRMLKFSSSADDSADSRDMTRWSKLSSNEESNTTSAASIRAKKTLARLNDLEDEMEALSERQAVRERRAANLRTLVAENAEESEAMDSALKKVHARVSKRAAKISMEM